MKKLLAFIAALAVSVACAALENTYYKQYGNVRIYYSAFNSNYIEPKIASTYHITRGIDRGLVNIAVVKNGESGGRTALVKGTVSNIMGQQQQLDFFEVREGDAVYYLAPFKFENEDSMTFKIYVRVGSNGKTRTLTFQRMFYEEK